MRILVPVLLMSFLAMPASAGVVAEYYFNGSASFNAGTDLLSIGSDASVFQSAGLPAALSVVSTGPGANVVGSEVNLSMLLNTATVLDTGQFTIANFNANPAQPVVSLYLGDGSGGTSATPVLTGTLSSVQLVGQDGNNAGVLTAYLHPTGGSAISYFSDPSNVIALNFDLTTTFSASMYQGNFSGQINGQVQSTTPVPLPASLWLFGSAAVALLGYAPRRRPGATNSPTDCSGEQHG